MINEVGHGARCARVTASMYSVDAVKRAAYTFMNLATVSLENEADGLVAYIDPIDANADLVKLKRDFLRELLDQDLRISLETKTEAIRSAVLGLAFSRTGLQSG